MSRTIKIKPWSGYESTADEIVLDEDDYDDEWWEDDEGLEWNTWPMMPVHPVEDGKDDE